MTRGEICENTPYILHTVGETTTSKGKTWECRWCGAKVLLREMRLK